MSSSFFSVEHVPRGILVQLSSEIDPLNLRECIETVEELVDAEPPTNVCLDLAHLHFIQSTGLGLLMRLNQRVKARGGLLALKGLKAHCLETVRVTRLDRLLAILTSEEELLDFWAGEQQSHFTPMSDLDEVIPPRVVNREAIDKEIFPWGQIYWLAKPGQTGCKRLQMSHGLISAGGKQPFHRHPAADEMLYVLSGKLMLWIEDQYQSLQAGDVAFLPEDTIHALLNESDSSCEIVSVYSPATTKDFTIDMSNEEPWKSLSKL